MKWFKVYTTIHDDPKIERLSHLAFRRYIYALSWSAAHDRDGDYELPGRTKPKWVDELVETGFLHETDQPYVYRIHGWDKRQVDYPSLVEARREAGRRGGLASAEARRSKVEASASSKPEANVKQIRLDKTRQEEEPIAPRKRDALFESVAEACGIDWEHLTPTARGSLNKAVAQIRGADGTPEDVRIRAANWPYDVPLTPPGLAKHWPSLTKPRPRTAGKARSVSNILALADGLENR